VLSEQNFLFPFAPLPVGELAKLFGLFRKESLKKVDSCNSFDHHGLIGGLNIARLQKSSFATNRE